MVVYNADQHYQQHHQQKSKCQFENHKKIIFPTNCLCVLYSIIFVAFFHNTNVNSWFLLEVWTRTEKKITHFSAFSLRIKFFHNSLVLKLLIVLKPNIKKNEKGFQQYKIIFGFNNAFKCYLMKFLKLLKSILFASVL